MRDLERKQMKILEGGTHYAFDQKMTGRSF